VTPFYFGAAGRQLFGALHPAQGGFARAALVICAPLFQEYVRTHRALWQLAEQLAAQGISVLRFDYFGCGDSAGEGSALDLDGAVTDILGAAARLSATTAVADPILFGLRGGASLAMLAQARRSEGRLLLWDPVIDGSAYVRDLRRLRSALATDSARYASPPRAVDLRDDDFLGYSVAPGFVGQLAALDLNNVHLKLNTHMTVAHWPADSAAQEFAQRQRAAGVTATTLALEAEAPAWNDLRAFEDMLAPRRSAAAIVRYLAA
jgi:uncharacterized protein